MPLLNEFERGQVEAAADLLSRHFNWHIQLQGALEAYPRLWVDFGDDVNHTAWVESKAGAKARFRREQEQSEGNQT